MTYLVTGATGFIGRNLVHQLLKREGDILAMASLQKRPLEHAATLRKPGGPLVYCTCSLEQEEGRHEVGDLLQHEGGVGRRPATAEEV